MVQKWRGADTNWPVFLNVAPEIGEVLGKKRAELQIYKKPNKQITQVWILVDQSENAQI